jgi:hypothetical protein
VRLRFSLTALLISSTLSTAWAEPRRAFAPKPVAESLIGDAKRDYDAARLLFDSGDYQGALLKFENAHRVSGDPRLLWNQAVCAKNLRRYARAIELVERYLDTKSPLVTTEAIEAGRAFLEAALPLTAKLTITASVPGATVYLDDRLIGTLPLEPALRVDLGMHSLRIKKFDYVDFDETLTVTDSTEIVVRAELRRILHQGTLAVQAKPGNAIAINGSVVGIGQWQGTLPSGRHRLRVTAAGARPYQTELVVVDNQTRSVNVTLEEARGGGIPAWVWISGGVLVASGLGVAGYYLFKPDEEELPRGSIAHVGFPLVRR